MANNFDTDARIIEYWLFENNLTAGKAGNDLTAGAGGVGYNSAAPLEGSYSLDLEKDSTQYASRTDANLSAGFPLKNGDTTKKFSWVLWMKPESLPDSQQKYIVTKSDAGINKGSFVLGSYGTTLVIWWSSNGIIMNYWNVVEGLVAGQVYHIGVAVDGVAKTFRVRLYDATADTATTYNTTVGAELYVSDAPFEVGASGGYLGETNYDGLIDELIVANDLLTDDEFDVIRNGEFGDNLKVAGVLNPTTVAGSTYAKVSGVAPA